ncbi:hypothetical protein HanXRQr2_Chr09g0390721 [Helianthus annuus]|uniref:Uncharacterized protein n=1 Tax=Helianthus annuus TaxID=4232 RepID=A0A9K3N8H1_HELAN|nr:hypothetical protein HanXRQr2_Chr09g0390721 [Helianthus annuus]KAJ0893352.1 hypothetical protein HanPSC8_Chr09g0376631 [Helianthus annuus]
MQLQESKSSSNTRDTDQSNNFPSFLKLIEEDDPLFLVKSKFEMDLDKFLIPNNKSHVYLVT